jgi:hypothetical protein
MAKRSVFVWLGIAAAALVGVASVGGVVNRLSRSRAVSETESKKPGASAGAFVACGRAMACCKAVMQKGSDDPANLTTCDTLANLPPSACEQSLTTYKRSASVLGVSCE